MRCSIPQSPIPDPQPLVHSASDVALPQPNWTEFVPNTRLAAWFVESHFYFQPQRHKAVNTSPVIYIKQHTVL